METDRRRRWLAGLIGLPVGIAMLARSAHAAAPSPARDDRGASLDAIAAREAIRDVLYRYARANDRADEAMMRSCFWPESTHKHGAFDGLSSDFVGYAMKVHHTIYYSTHFITNAAVEVNGDRAFSECYYAAHHRRPKAGGTGEEDAFFEGRYLDFLERRGEEWRIIRRRGLADYTTVMAAATPYSAWPAGNSHHGPDDEYFAMRRAFLSKAQGA